LTPGAPDVPVRPIAEALGLAWQPQHEKLTGDRARFSVTIIVTETPAGPRPMICIPVTRIAGWLMSISPNKVRPELRERLIGYQQECDQALFDYWSRGAAFNPRGDAALLRTLQEELLSCHPMYRRLRRYVEAGLSEEDMSRLTLLSPKKLRQRLGAMRDLGLLPGGGHG
jgi:hypothetical protein